MIMRGMRLRFAIVAGGACLFVLAATGCSGGVAPPVPTLVEPSATAAPSATPTATATPRPTPGPAAGPLAGTTVVRDAPLGTAQTVYAGTLLEFRLTGLEPLERLRITELPPQGTPQEAGFVRADRQGAALWRKDTLGMAKGAWRVQAAGDGGSNRTLSYVLANLPLPVGNGAREGIFTVYRTPDAAFFFTDDVDAAAVVLALQYYRQAMPQVLKDFSFTFDEPVDFYLVKGSEALLREIQAGGADQITGLEQGVSLVGFSRSGVYLDMNAQFNALPHLVIHEATHQVTSRIDERRQAPVWLLEGLSEYEAVKQATPLAGDAERRLRRERRVLVREAIAQQRWIDLRDFGELGQLKAEQTKAWLDQGYAQSFVVADYVAQVYGEQALRPLLEQLSRRPAEQDAVFGELFSVTFDRFQEQVRAWVMQLEADEVEAQGLRTFAAEMVRLVSAAEAVSQEWNSYVAARANLSAPQRTVRLQALAGENERLGVRARALLATRLGEDSRTVYLDGVAAFARAIDAFQRYERTRIRIDLDAGNGALAEANHFVQATVDRLATALAGAGLPRDLAFGEKAAP
ncbi:MAG: hypothetical protein EXR49_07890 [Dehalococcoidia bacterium]|nr:hypothetical protein [Dehalococcoidia bacterium]